MKRRKPGDEENDGTDMMSSLPESVVCHILSFLSIKTAVATNLVSRRWRNLWKHRQVFHFDDDFSYSYERFKKFAFFVNAVLSLRTSRDIRKFRLHCGIMYEHKFPSNCINTWISAAIGPHLQELDLHIANPYDTPNPILPSSLLNCTNLVSLSLVGEIKMKVQHSSVHFPSLKWLKLDICVMDSDIAFLSGCPVLETLHIYFNPRLLTKVPVTPSSKKLKFNNGNFSWTCLQIDSNDWLDEVYSWGSAKTTLGIIGNVHSVVEAYLDVFLQRESEFVDPILNRFRYQGPGNELYLQLCHSTEKWPLRAPVINNPEFCNLLHLKFILPCFNLNLLVNILEKCHMLQVLILQIDKEEPSPVGACELQSTTVPKCLESHLTYIHIEGYQGFEEELTFAEYILLNGLVLKTMLIFVDISMDITNKYRSLKRLTRVPKGSVTCQLEFDADVSP